MHQRVSKTISVKSQLLFIHLCNFDTRKIYCDITVQKFKWKCLKCCKVHYLIIWYCTLHHFCMKMFECIMHRAFCYLLTSFFQLSHKSQKRKLLEMSSKSTANSLFNCQTNSKEKTKELTHNKPVKRR